MKQALKILAGAPLKVLLRLLRAPREYLRRLYAHAALAADLDRHLPSTAVILGKTWVYGTRNISIGDGVLLYPEVHLETRKEAVIRIGDGAVISRGAHLVAMAGIEIGQGSMIGEYASVRDANHNRSSEITIRDAGYISRPITIGREVWIGRGVTVLGGITIGDYATVGANAVVTHDVPAGAIVAGVPAVPIRSRASQEI